MMFAGVCLLVLAVPCVAWQTPWSTSNNTLLFNAKPVVLHGVSSTCTEYLLRGIGEKCWASYEWSDPSSLLGTLNAEEVVALTGVMAAANGDGVMPAVRIPLTASSWLGVATSAAKANMDKYPKLSQQYQGLIQAFVSNLTANGIVAVLDLHWNDDDTEQQPMALKTRSDGGPTGNALDFWDSIATVFAENDMVFFELYNEPHLQDLDVYMNGNSQYAGMVEMIKTVRLKAPDTPLIVAGALGYAYDAESLVELDAAIPSVTNVIFNFHPYMGPAQAGASNKCPAGFSGMVDTIKTQTSRPFIITEFGQACCPTSGVCESCPQAAHGMGYDEAIINIVEVAGGSWMPWAWRPGAGSTSGSQCEDFNGGPNPSGLSPAPSNKGNGADWSTLWPMYAGRGGLSL